MTSCSCFRRWSEAVEKWQQFHCDMKEIGSWLSDAESRLQGTVNNDGTLNETLAKDLQQANSYFSCAAVSVVTTVCLRQKYSVFNLP